MKLMLVLMQPPGPLLHVLMEHACDLAPALAHVESARVVERHVTEAGDRRVTQHWRAHASVPALLQPHLDTGLQDWTLTLQQPAGEALIRFHAASHAVQVPGRCEGTLRLLPAAGGRGTRIELEADFPATGEGLRTIFGAMLARHWRTLCEAAAARVSATTG